MVEQPIASDHRDIASATTMHSLGLAAGDAISRIPLCDRQADRCECVGPDAASTLVALR